VYPDVDDDLLDRTKKWLLAKRNGKGGFVTGTRRMYEFYGSNEELVNAYVVYGLSEAGVKEIGPEFAASYQYAHQGDDLYLKALLANAAFNLGSPEKAQALLDQLWQQVDQDGWANARMQTSITYSRGRSLQVETQALALLALAKAPQPDFGRLQNLATELFQQRSLGGFGSTQATIMALRALTAYSRLTRQASEGGKWLVYLNGQLLHTETYQKGQRGYLQVPNLAQHLRPGPQLVRVVFEQTSTPLPYSLNLEWHALTPNASPDRQVDLATQLAADQAQVGSTVRLSTTLRNLTDQALPMTLAVVGIPSGLSAQPWQLKELQEKNVVDFYEVRQNYVVFYYRSLAARASHQIYLDLKAEVPGQYQAPASTAYLYYDNAHKHWQPGTRVRVVQ
jgi:alpha-2-macroglobulin-like protein